MLCRGSQPPPPGAGWQREPKWDGVRTIITIVDGQTKLRSRLGNDITAAYPELAKPLAQLTLDAVLDGEIIALDDEGRPSFNRLQERMHVRDPPPSLLHRTPVRLVLFDVLWRDGTATVHLPQQERRTLLEHIVEAAWPGATGAITLSPLLDTVTSHADMLAATTAVGFEGYVAKRVDAPYLTGRRSPAWVKVKAVSRADLVVGGWEPGEGGRSHTIGSLALGLVVPQLGDALVEGGPCLRYVGNAGSGLSDAMLTALWPLTERFSVTHSPFVDLPAARERVTRPLAPVLVVDVEYAMVSPNGHLRFPVVKGLRPDKRPADCIAL